MDQQAAEERAIAVESIHILVAGEAAPFQKKTASWQAKDGRFGTHAYDSKRFSSWKDQARYAASKVMGDTPPLTGPLRLEIIVYREIPQSMSMRQRRLASAGTLRPCLTPDWDNLGKAVGDALIGIVIRDDKFIVSGHVEKFYSDRPRVEITVSSAESAPALKAQEADAKDLPLFKETGP